MAATHDAFNYFCARVLTAAQNILSIRPACFTCTPTISRAHPSNSTHACHPHLTCGPLTKTKTFATRPWRVRPRPTCGPAPHAQHACSLHDARRSGTSKTNMSQHGLVKEPIVYGTDYHACGCHMDGTSKIYEHQTSREHTTDMTAQDLMATCETFTWIATSIHNRTM